MSSKKDMPSDFSDFLLDDEFIRLISDLNNPMDYVNYINDLKKIYPDQAENIDLAVEVFFVMKNDRTETNHDQKQKIWNKIIADRAKEKWLLLFRVAASFLILLGLGGTAFYLTSRNRHSAIEEFAKTTQPSFNKSQLILSDGKNIFIPDYESKIAYSSNGKNVIINDTTSLVRKLRQRILTR